MAAFESEGQALAKKQSDMEKEVRPSPLIAHPYTPYTQFTPCTTTPPQVRPSPLGDINPLVCRPSYFEGAPF